MNLIAESGSSKTSWLLTDKGKQLKSFTTAGFNPYVQKREQILEIIKTEVCSQLEGIQAEHLFFYGAGCSTEENKKLMFSCFRNFMSKTNIEIEHDLLGAARACWTGQSGIVVILGTGSNSCVYEKGEITENVPSLGYILGDEGSGAYMGKILIRDYLYGKLPVTIHDKLKKEYQIDKEKVLDRIYKAASPNRWLASFSLFIRDNIKEEYCSGLVRTSFRDFFKRQLSSYSGYKALPLAAVGSIAFHYKDFLAEAASEAGFRLEKIVKSPVEELAKYHNLSAKKTADVAAND
jgi:N-acetylglucosamine kinase-like BadF-type ATPase